MFVSSFTLDYTQKMDEKSLFSHVCIRHLEALLYLLVEAFDKP